MCSVYHSGMFSHTEMPPFIIIYLLATKYRVTFFSFLACFVYSWLLSCFSSPAHAQYAQPKLLCQLFDAFVGSVLSYSVDVWGFTKCKEIERVHPTFCKKKGRKMLNVRMRSS